MVGRGTHPYRVPCAHDGPLRSVVRTADVSRSGRWPRPKLRPVLPPLPAVGKEVTEVKDLFKRMWFSPVLLIVLVYVLGAPRKWPKG